MTSNEAIAAMRDHGASPETVLEACTMAAPMQRKDIETLQAEGYSIETIVSALDDYDALYGVAAVEAEAGR